MSRTGLRAESVTVAGAICPLFDGYLTRVTAPPRYGRHKGSNPNILGFPCLEPI
jgi:hypothetical protein